AVEAAVSGGAHAGGFVAYEAAPALDPTLTTRPPREGLPLVWFGLFSEREEVSAPPAGDPDEATFDRPWTAAIEPEAYARRVAAVREWIASGDTYQVNLTFPLRSVT